MRVMSASATARAAYLAIAFFVACSACGVVSAHDIQHDTDLDVLPAELLGQMATSELSAMFLKTPQSSVEAREQAERLQEAIQPDEVGTIHNLFVAWSRLYTKRYAPGDQVYEALAAFKTSLHSILHHNQQEGGAIYSLTEYSGMAPPPTGSVTTSGPVDSKSAQGRRKVAEAAVAGRPPFMSIPKAAHMNRTVKVGGVPNLTTNETRVDWRTTDQLTPVRSQGQCSSCWAHSSASAMEAAAHIAYNTTYSATNISLSRQILVSCANGNVDPIFSVDNGCKGGNAADAIKFMGKYQIPMESTYNDFSSTTGDAGICQFASLTKSTDGNYLQDSQTSPDLANALNEAKLQAAVATQPVVIYWNMGVNFMNYAGNVYDLQDQNNSNYGCISGAETVNHAMMVIGYDNISKIWMLQNSFGSTWGEVGFMTVRMTHDKSGPCAMYTFVLAPALEFQHVPTTFPGA